MNQRNKGYPVFFNPFIRYGDGTIYLFGGIIFLCSIATAYFTGTHISGFFAYKLSAGYPLNYYAGAQLIHLCTLTILSYVSGLLLSGSNLRLIDVLGTLLIARIPFLIAINIRFLPVFESFVIYSTEWVLYKVLFYLCACWCLILTYHALHVSTNLPSKKLPWIYVLTILLSEIVTYVSIQQLLHFNFIPL